MMREREKRVILDGRTFVIKKMPAARGFALLCEILTKALPLNIIGGALEDFIPASLLNLENKQQMSMEDFEKLLVKLLSDVSEQLPAGDTPIIDKQGHFQVVDLEDDMLLFGQLIWKVLVFQYKDFFLETLAKLGINLENPEALPGKFQDILNAPPTSVNTYSPPLWPDTGDNTSCGMAPIPSMI